VSAQKSPNVLRGCITVNPGVTRPPRMASDRTKPRPRRNLDTDAACSLIAPPSWRARAAFARSNLRPRCAAHCSAAAMVQSNLRSARLYARPHGSQKSDPTRGASHVMHSFRFVGALTGRPCFALPHDAHRTADVATAPRRTQPRPRTRLHPTRSWCPRNPSACRFLPKKPTIRRCRRTH